MKKKLIVIGIILAIIAAAIGITAAINSKTGNKGPVDALGYTTTLKETPTDDSTVLDYDSYDNLAMVAYVMANSDFNGVTEGEVTAKVAFINYVQEVYNIRTVIDDEAFQQAVSTSSLKSVAIQKYFYLDEQKVLTRNPNKIDGKNTTWLDEDPTVYSNRQYLERYGWLPNQISSYILCKDSILDISEVELREDGYYQLVVNLNTSIAPANYQYEVKEYGGSDGFPSFSSIQLTVVFNEDWQLYQLISDEVYDITMPVIGSITCTGHLVETFNYDNLELGAFDYFDQYKDLQPSDEVIVDTSLKPLDYLMYGFGSYLSGEVIYINADITLNNYKINGKLFVDLTNSRYGFLSKDLAVLVDKEVYIAYDELKFKINIEEFSTLLNDLMPSDNSSLNMSTLVDTDLIMDQLSTSTIIEDGNNVSMISNLTLLGMNIPVEFNFTNIDNKDISINSVKANFSIKDLNINIEASFTKDSFDIVDDFDKYQDALDADFVIDDITSIINNKALGLNINLVQPDLTINGDITLDFNDELKANGNLDLVYQDTNINLLFTYIDDTLYLDVNNLKLQVSASKVLEVLNNNVDVSASDLSISQIVDFIFTTDFKKILGQALLTETSLDLSLDLTDYNLNTYNISLKDLDNGLSLNIAELGLTLTLNSNVVNTNIVAPEGSYLDISNVIDHIDELKDLFTSPYLNINLNSQIALGTLAIPVNADINIDMTNLVISGNVNINLFGKDLLINILYKDNNLYAKVGNNLIVNLTVEELLSYIPESNNNELDLTLVNDLLNKLVISLDDSLNISLDSYELEGLSLTNTTITISKGNEFTAPTYEANITKTDIDNLINQVNKVINLLTTNNISLSTNINGIAINAIIDKNLNVEAYIEYSGLQAKVNYYHEDNSIYVTYKDIVINTTIDEVINLVNKYLPEDTIPSIDTSSLDLNDLIKNLVITENTISLSIMNYEIAIDTIDDVELSVLDYKVYLDSTTDSVSAKPESSIALSTLIPYVDKVLELIENNYLNINLNTTLIYGEYDINVSGSIKLDINNLIVSGNLVVSYNDLSLNINLLYKDNSIYVQIGNNLVVNLTVEELLSYLPESTSETTIDLDSILTNLTANDESIVITLLDEYIISIDSNLTISVADINIEGITLSNINLSVAKAKEFEAPTYEANITKTDIDNLINQVNKVINLLTTNNINLSTNINGIAINAIIDKNLNVEAIVEYSGLQLKVNYYHEDNSIYVTYKDIVISTTIDEVINLVNKYLPEDTIPSIDTSSLDLNSLISDLTITENTISLTVLDYTINLDTTDDVELSVLDYTVYLNSTADSVSAKPESSIALSTLIPYVDKVLELTENNYLNINLNTTLAYGEYDINVSGSIKLDINSLIVSGNLVVSYNDLSLNINLLYKDNSIYVQIGNNLVVNLTVEELLSYIPESNNDSNIDLDSILTNLTANDESIVITLLEDYVLTINQDLTISLNTIDFNGLSVSGTSLSLTAIESFEAPTYEANITKTDIGNLINQVNKVIDLLTKANISLSTNINGIAINAIIDKNLNVEAYIEYSGLQAKVNYYHEDNSIYVTYKDIVINTTIDEVINLVNKYLPEDTIPSIDTSSLDLNDLIKNLVITENTISLTVLDYTINLDTTDDVEVSVLDYKVYLDSTTDNVSTKPESSISLSTLIPYVDKVLELIENNYLNINLNTTLIYGEYDINVSGSIKLDINNLIVSGNLVVSYNDLSLNINLLYKDNSIYVQIGNNLVVNLTVEELLSYIPESTSDSNIDFDSILTNLTASDESIVITLLEEYIITIDSNLNISLADINIEGITLSNINVSVAKGEEFTAPECEANITKTDIDNLINQVNKVINLLTTNNISLSTNINGIAINAIIDKNLNVEAIVEYSGLQLKVNYYHADNSIYVTYKDIVINTTIDEVITLVNKYLPEDTIPSIDTSSLDLNSLISDLTITENTISLSVLDYTINLDTTDDVEVSVLDYTVYLDSTTDNVSVKPESSISLSTLIPYVDKVLELIENNYLNINLNTTLTYGEYDINVSGSIKLDINNLIVSGNLVVSYNDLSLNINLLYKDNSIYVQIGNNLVVNLTVEELLSYLPESTSETTIDLDSILTNLTASDEAIVITLLEDYVLTINQDLTISLNTIEFNGLSVSGTELSISSTDEFEAPTYEANITKTDIDNLINQVNKVINLLTTNNINLSTNINGIAINAIIDKNLNVEAIVEYSGLQLKVNYYHEDNSIYVTYKDIVISTNIDEVINLVNKYLPEDTIPSIDTSSLDLNSLISDLTITENTISLSILDYTINLDTTDDVEVSVLDYKVYLDSTTDSVSTKPESSIALSTLIPYVDKVLELIDNNCLNINLNTTLTYGEYDINVAGSIKLDINNLIVSGNLVVSYNDLSLNIELLYKDNSIYVQIGNNLVVNLTVEELLSYIPESNNDSNIDLDSILTSLTANDEAIVITLLDEYTITIDSNLNISLADINIEGITLSNINVSVAKGEEFEAPTYEADIVKADIDNLINQVNKVIDLLTKANIKASFSYNGINGSFVVDKDYNISGTISINNIELNIKYIDEVVYLNYQNVGIKGTINDILTFINNLELVDTNSVTSDIDLNSLISNLVITENTINVNILDYSISLDTTSNLNILVNDEISLIVESTNEIVDKNLNINYLDINDFNVFVPSIKAIMNNDSLVLTLNTNISYQSYSFKVLANITINFNSGISANITINDVLNISLSYSNNNLIVKFNNNILVLTSEEIKELFSKNLDNSINISDIISNIYFNENKDLVLDLNISDYSLNIRIDSNLNIYLANLEINGIIVEDTSITTLINNDNINIISEAATINYAQLKTLIDNINGLVKTFNGDVISLDLTTRLDSDVTGMDIKASLLIDIKNFNISGYVDFITNKDVTHHILIDYVDNYLYLSYGNLGIKATIDELLDIVNKALALLETEVNTEVNVDIYSIINSLYLDINNSVNIAISNIPTIGSLSLSLANNTITLGDLGISSVTVSDTVISLDSVSLFETNKLDVDYLTYDKLLLALDYVDMILGLMEKDNFKLNVEGTVVALGETYNVSGTIEIKLVDGSLNLAINLALDSSSLDHYLSIYLVDEIVDESIGLEKVIYFRYNNDVVMDDTSLNVKATTRDISELMDTFSAFINFDYADIENGIEQVKGFDIFNIIDSYDFTKIINAIIINEDNLQISLLKEMFGLDNDLTITLSKDKTVEILGFGMGSIEIPQLSASLTDDIVEAIIRPEVSYYDLGGTLNPFFKAVLNDSMLKLFDMTGKISAKLGSLSLANIPLNSKIRRVDGTPYPEVFMGIGPIPVSSILTNNDLSYSNVDDSRYFDIYYGNQDVYMHRHERVYYWSGLSRKKKDYQKKLYVDQEEFLSNVMYYLMCYGMGFAEDGYILNMVKQIKVKETIDFTSLINNIEYDKTNGKYTISINLKAIFEESTVSTDSVDIYIYEETINGLTYLSKIEFDMTIKFASIITISLKTEEPIQLNNISSLNNLDNYLSEEEFNTQANDFMSNYYSGIASFTTDNLVKNTKYEKDGDDAWKEVGTITPAVATTVEEPSTKEEDELTN